MNPGHEPTVPSRQGRIPWARLYQKLSQSYGWTPQQIDQLTIYQACLYLGAWSPEHGPITIGADDPQVTLLIREPQD